MNDSDQRLSELEAGQAIQLSATVHTDTDMDGGTLRQLSLNNTDLTLKPFSASQDSPDLSPSLWASVRSTLSRIGTRKPSDQAIATQAQIVRRLDDCPRGYPKLAAFLDSDECFSVYRRFGFLQSRLLLNKQDRLRDLEEALDSLDEREESVDEKHPMSLDVDDDVLEPRQKLFAAIEREFTSYASLLDTGARLTSLSRPSEADYASVQNFCEYRPPLLSTENTWYRHKEDLVTLRAGREHAWLDAGIEKALRWFHCPAVESLFGDERTKQKSSGIEVYYSRTRINALASAIITFMVLILMVIPIWLLYHFMNQDGSPTSRSYTICMGILLVSTLAFSAVLSLFTRAKRHEILAAAAAYCAVLVVFFGNLNPAGKS